MFKITYISRFSRLLKIQRDIVTWNSSQNVGRNSVLKKTWKRAKINKREDCLFGTSGVTELYFGQVRFFKNLGIIYHISWYYSTNGLKILLITPIFLIKGLIIIIIIKGFLFHASNNFTIWLFLQRKCVSSVYVARYK